MLEVSVVKMCLYSVRRNRKWCTLGFYLMFSVSPYLGSNEWLIAIPIYYTLFWNSEYNNCLTIDQSNLCGSESRLEVLNCELKLLNLLFPTFIFCNKSCGLVSPYTLHIKFVIPFFILRSEDIQIMSLSLKSIRALFFIKKSFLIIPATHNGLLSGPDSCTVVGVAVIEGEQLSAVFNLKSVVDSKSLEMCSNMEYCYKVRMARLVIFFLFVFIMSVSKSKEDLGVSPAIMNSIISYFRTLLFNSARLSLPIIPMYRAMEGFKPFIILRTISS
ncbi:hypothetical protein AGLY_008795 [Aphis glycines]|uniref:Uncharacterized protein n=1 Tax=Aphis glycines TaxID=307491 RepID=A0A6G0TJS0_APHGL|nr:hypothetical protein AGLY_008795 [Aphis glycines]